MCSSDLVFYGLSTAIRWGAARPPSSKAHLALLQILTPGANADPYEVAARILTTVCGAGSVDTSEFAGLLETEEGRVTV